MNDPSRKIGNTISFLLSKAIFLYLHTTLDYLCVDCTVCGLSMHDHKLLMTNDLMKKVGNNVI